MPDLTFGEQVKIVLGRKGMTIKELAEMIEQRTNKKMSRQNLTQRLGRDNFQEQDMRMIASILECSFKLSILGEDTPDEEEMKEAVAAAEPEEESTQEAGTEEEAQEKEVSEEETEAEGEEEEDAGREITVGEFLEIRKSSGESAQEKLMQELLAEMDSIEREGRERSVAWERRRQKKEQQEAEKKPEKKGGWMSHFRFRKHEESEESEEHADEETIVSAAEGAAAIDTADTEGSAMDNEEQKSKASESANTFSERIKEYTMQDDDLRDQLYEDEEEDLEAGDVNPYTGREYSSNSVRMHPKRIGYVQVYNRKDHRWTDMTEWAFLGYQERKKVLLGKDYEPPIYLD